MHLGDILMREFLVLGIKDLSKVETWISLLRFWAPRYSEVNDILCLRSCIGWLGAAERECGPCHKEVSTRIASLP